jgi:N-acetylglutamate synthase-like GNAT family acetyltransferase
MGTLLNEDETGVVCLASPATPDDLDWIFRLEIEAYSAQYAVARRTLEQWYGCNPDGFSVFTINGRRIGHLTILPLRPTILESFAQGTIEEQELNAASLYTPGEKQLVRNLYFESIITDSGGAPATLPIKALTCVAREFVPLISRISEPANLENVYALAASGRGERLLEGLGFERVRSDRERADKRTLYAASFSALKTNIAEVYDRRLRKN